MLITAQAYEAVARQVLSRPNGWKGELSAKSQKKMWSCFFGTTPIVAAEIWNRMEPDVNVDPNCKPKHLLYGLLLLKKYSGDEISAMTLDCHTNTFSKWAWVFIEEVHDMHVDVIKLENRFINWDQTRTNCGLVEDCTDCPILEPWPFDSTYWSHKLNGPALKYAITMAIHSGYIVHWAGPFKPSVSDITIFRNDLMNQLNPLEPIEVDSGGGGEFQTKPPQVAKSRVGRSQKSKVRAKMENCIGKVKVFDALNVAFRHSHDKHKLAFGAILVITQLGLELGTLGQYPVDYDTEYF